jgi:hypothetical protein
MTMAAKRVIRLIAGMSEGERESLTLAALRDTLLHNLISNDLLLIDAERIAGIA